MALSNDAVEAIKTMIVDGRLRAGDRLPVEKDLAEALGLSRGTLREAVRALRHAGWEVRARPWWRPRCVRNTGGVRHDDHSVSHIRHPLAGREQRSSVGST